MNKIPVVLFSFVLLINSISFGLEKKTKVTDQTKFKFTSLKKSLVFPGWGQFAEKRYIEGFLFSFSEIFILYKIFSNNHKGNSQYELYKNAANVDNAVKYRELTEKYDKRRNQFLFAALGIWAVNLIDIYVIVKNKEKNKLKIKLESENNKSLAVTVCFSF